MDMNGNRLLKAAVFDLDGVILDSMPWHVCAWQEVFQNIGLVVDDGFFYRHEGNLEWDHLKDRLSCGSEISFESFQSLARKQRVIFTEKYSSNVRLFPEAEAILQRLAAGGIKLALVTSSHRQVMSSELSVWLDRFFHQVVTGDQVQRSKPYPEPYSKAIELLGVLPSEAVAVENAPAGIESARKAGLTCLALATTLPGKDLADADRVLLNHAALLAHLECLFLLS